MSSEQERPSRAKLRSRATLLALRNTVDEGVLELLCREMWDTPLQEFVEGQGWLRERLCDAQWIVTAPDRRDPAWLSNLIWMQWFNSQDEWDRAIRECSRELCETLHEMDYDYAEIATPSHTLFRCLELGDPVSYECTRRYVQLGL